VTEQELVGRKQGIIGSYQVGLSTTGGIASTILADIQRGYELSWLDDYPKAVNALTRDQVNTAIHTHLNPSNMVLVKVGSISAAPAAK
jgi:zinc protease